ncbi:MAG TPA: ATP12 family protein [Devosia sp.]
MRDFIEDAYEHRQDGYGRAQAANKAPLMKRFYRDVSVAPAEGGFAILLDGKNMKTPGGKPVHVPTEALARAMAREWDAQETEIDFREMPLVRLAHSAIESGAEGAPAFRDEIVKYAGNDLLLYRADSPDSLVEDQLGAWDPVLAALAAEFGVRFEPTVGIIHQPQPEATLMALAENLQAEDHMALAALMQMVSLTGSALLTIAYRRNLIDSGTVWTAAHVDEDHNIRLWGEDDEASRRRAQRFVEFTAALDMLRTLGE